MSHDIKVESKVMDVENTAKIDVSTVIPSLASGIYRLNVVAVDGGAKMGAWIVELTAIPMD